MVVFLLCVIIAILLMGSSRFIGALGYIGGAILFAVGSVYLGNALDMRPVNIMFMLFFLFIGLVVFGNLYFWYQGIKTKAAHIEGDFWDKWDWVREENKRRGP